MSVNKKKAAEPRQRFEGSELQIREYKNSSDLSTSYSSYIQAVFSPDDIAEFRLIREGHVRKDWAFAQDCLSLETKLRAKNQQGWNVFVGVNPRIQIGKSGDANVKLARWLFADFDHVEPGDGCGRWEFISDLIYRAGLDMPDLVVSSGNGLHCYWQLSKPLMDMERWRKTQERLILTLHSDPAVKNPERLMRIPGFKNMKDRANPRGCFIVIASIK